MTWQLIAYLAGGLVSAAIAAVVIAWNDGRRKVAPLDAFFGIGAGIAWPVIAVVLVLVGAVRLLAAVMSVLAELATKGGQ